MTLFGYGKTTSAIAKKFGNCAIYDDSFTSVETFGTNTLLPMDHFNPETSECEIPSPGIPPHHPKIMQARHLISEYDLFCESMPFSIWISGTNGKTTTTQMLTHLLASKGALAGGNIGTPLAELNSNAPLWILESSSFTLHYTKHAAPNIYILLPIAEDHISWHGDFDAYIGAKLNPLSRMKEGEMALVPACYQERVHSNGFIVYYENTQDLADYFEIDLSKVHFKEPFLLDAISALAVQKALFGSVDYELINNFVVDKHKLECFYDAQKRLWVDDSKATNIDATIQAIKSYGDQPLHLILGGDDKGMLLHPLFEALKPLQEITLYVIGKNYLELSKLALEYHIPCVECGFLDVAISKIAPNHTVKSVAMLSPAAASLDQFSSYKERGECFQKAVLAL